MIQSDKYGVFICQLHGSYDGTATTCPRCAPSNVEDHYAIALHSDGTYTDLNAPSTTQPNPAPQANENEAISATPITTAPAAAGPTPMTDRIKATYYEREGRGVEDDDRDLWEPIAKLERDLINVRLAAAEHARTRQEAYEDLEHELADMKHDLERAIANHSADLSAPSAIEPKLANVGGFTMVGLDTIRFEREEDATAVMNAILRSTDGTGEKNA